MQTHFLFFCKCSLSSVVSYWMCIYYTKRVNNHTEICTNREYNNSRKVFAFPRFYERGETDE